ncbi:hypothetical protein NC653_005483 [Populus alba x Populus x berolinensis]|uniref:Uncharacterized protein n=1 Tax=Populus alba x Populus x berolinensis TaxID=444605 RepID=A0AAD6WB19_9ROSI|nr:hypothetical protein NC653_005483 [Populus alba x Populus x berolinensis]
MPCVAPMTEGLSEEKDVKKEPGQQTGGGADMSVKNGQRCVCADSVRITAVETTPSHPKQPSTCQHQCNVVWWEPFSVLGPTCSTQTVSMI